MLDIVGVTIESLDAVLADRCSDQHVKQAGLIVLQCLVDSHLGSLTRLRRRSTHLNLRLVVNNSEHIQLAVLCIPGIPDHGKGRVDAQCLAMKSRNLGRAIDDGRAELQHCGVGKGLQYDFIAYAVDIAVRNGYANFSLFHNIYCF